MPYKQQLINRLELLAIADFIITVWLAMLLTLAGDSTQEASNQAGRGISEVSTNMIRTRIRLERTLVSHLPPSK